MTRIAIDTLPIHPPDNYGGIYEYTRQMLHHFRTMAPEFGCDITTYMGTNYGPLQAELPDTNSFRTIATRGIDNPRFWRYGGFATSARRANADVAFFPVPEVLPFRMLPYIATFHDVAYMSTRGYSSFKSWRMYTFSRMIARHANCILANSECTKSDIVKYFDVPPEKVRVVYLAINHNLYNDETVSNEVRRRVAEQFQLKRPYIVHHGTLREPKNLVRLIEAYQLMLRRHPEVDFDLVLIGNKGWNCGPTLAAAAKVAPPGRVVLTGIVDENVLPVLVKGARLAVIPSLYEGFCLPMLEAMACGVPTIVADNSCLPEVSGGGLRYFSAESVEEISQTMYDVLQSPAELQRLREFGLRRSSEFTWERCARETLKAIQAVAGNV